MLIQLLITVLFRQILCSPEEWNQMFHSFAKYESKQIESDIEFAKSVYSSTKLSNDCNKSLNQTLEALRNSELFAYQLYDSWPQFPPKAVLEGTLNDFGDYDQCVAITPNLVIGSTQYCLIRLSVPLPNPTTVHLNVNHKINEIVAMFKNRTSEHVFTKLADNAIFFRLFPIKLGVCLPDMCDQNDVQLLTEKAFENSGLMLENVDCNTKTDNKLNVMQIIAM